MVDILKKLAEFFPKVGRGMGHIGEGIGEEVVDLVYGFTDLGQDVGYLVYYTTEFLITNMSCILYYLQNTFKPDCVIWYVVRLIACILYGMTFGITFLIVYMISGIDLEKKFWNYIYTLETMTGFKFTDFPNVILKKCFNCRRLKVTEFVNVWKRFLVAGDDEKPSDIKLIIGEALQGFIKIGDGFDEIISAF